MSKIEDKNSTNKYLFTLGIILSIQFFGEAGIAYTNGTHIESYFFLNLGLASNIGRIFNLSICVLLVVTGILGFFSKKPIIYFGTAAYFLVDSFFHTYLGGSFGSQNAIPAHAVRYILPAMMGFLLIYNNKNGISLAENSSLNFSLSLTLKIAIGLVFLAHGIEAINQHPKFIDFIIGSTRKLSGINMDQGIATDILYAFGLIDLILVALLFWPKMTWAVYYMAFWGFVTAAARIVYFEENGIFLFLVRSSNYGAPIALVYLWYLSSNSSNKNTTDATFVDKPAINRKIDYQEVS